MHSSRTDGISPTYAGAVALPYDTPTALLAHLAGADPTRPRLTWYDDQAGPTQGERIELSGRVLANWAAKAANLLQDEDIGPGSVVGLDLPTHWRAAYWLLAAWSVGAEVVVAGPAADPASNQASSDLLVTSVPQLQGGKAAGTTVAVTLAALAREWIGDPLTSGTIDEAKELATYGDRFDSWAAPDPDSVALRAVSDSWTYAELLPAASAAAAAAGLGDGARVLTSAGPDSVVRAWLPAWVVDGSLVLVRPDPGEGTDNDAGRDATLDRRASAERVTARL
jgi:uncharacterized protein (TIGR03089 family)